MQIATSKNLTIVGIAMIVGALAAAASALFDGDPATNPNWEATVTALVTGFGFVMAKGQANTGGTVPATPEAKARVSKPLAMLLVFGALAFAVPARADDSRLLPQPRVSSRSGRLTLQLSQEDLTVHPMLGVSPLFGYNFSTKQAVAAPSLVSAVELDVRGYGGPTLGLTGSVGQTGVPNLTLGAGVSFHPPQLAEWTSGAVTNVVVQYQRTLVGEPSIDQVVAGPALVF